MRTISYRPIPPQEPRSGSLSPGVSGRGPRSWERGLERRRRAGTGPRLSESSVASAQPSGGGLRRGRCRRPPPTPRTCSWISCSSELLSIEPGGAGGRGRRPRPEGAALRTTPLRPGPPAPPAPFGAASRSQNSPPPRARCRRRPHHARPGHARAPRADAPREGTAPTGARVSPPRSPPSRSGPGLLVVKRARRLGN